MCSGERGGKLVGVKVGPDAFDRFAGVEIKMDLPGGQKIGAVHALSPALFCM